MMKCVLISTAALLVVALLSGCGTASGTATVDCEGWEPIFVGDQDALTDETAESILEHNEYGERLGCW